MSTAQYFTERLLGQQHLSAHTIASYRDTFRLWLTFASQERRKAPSQLTLPELDAPLVSAFLTHLEDKRSISARTRNLRLTAIRSFFRFAAFEAPEHSAQIQRVLAIPPKRHAKRCIHFLNRAEIDALLKAPDRTSWLGRRDHALLIALRHLICYQHQPLPQHKCYRWSFGSKRGLARKEL